jgi:DNA (cytosine-5)-methyltransferase 1
VYVKTTRPHSKDEAPTIIESGISPTLSTFDIGDSRANVYVLENHPQDSRIKIANDLIISAVDCRNATENKINGTLQAKESGGTSLNLNNVCRCGSVVRRLTPLECEHLQGYPSGWTDIGDWIDTKGKNHKAADSPRYKALGNSIAIPCWRFILQGISDRCREHTMASLFAGIGGFELCSLQVGIKPIWNSEVEEFCIAVTKKHFGNGDEKGDYEQYL